MTKCHWYMYPTCLWVQHACEMVWRTVTSPQVPVYRYIFSNEISPCVFSTGYLTFSRLRRASASSVLLVCFVFLFVCRQTAILSVCHCHTARWRFSERYITNTCGLQSLHNLPLLLTFERWKTFRLRGVCPSRITDQRLCPGTPLHEWQEL